MNLTELSIGQLKKAVALKEGIAKLEAELAALAGSSSPTAPAPTARKKGGMSAAGRARIAAAQKKRWAKIKSATTVAKVPGASKPTTPTATPAAKPAKKKWKLSAAGLAKIKAANKAYWAKKKAAKAGKKT